MQQLSQQDAMFLYSESPRVPMHLGSLHVYDPSFAPEPVTFERILDHVRSRLPLARVLRRKILQVPLGLDLPYWIEDDAFDLEFHVRNIALPPPGNRDQLWVQASRLHSQPLDLTRPPWELYIIDGLDTVEGFPPGCFAMFIKCHHAAIDGISGIELMNALHDLTPKGRDAPVDEWHSEDPPGAVELVARAGLNLTQAPVRLYRAAQQALPALQALPLVSPAARTGRLPQTTLNARSTTNRVGDGLRFDLDTAKAIRKAVPGATVNDVVLAVVAGGLRSYLQAHDALPDRPLHAGVPISMRTAEEMGTAGNKISIMVVSLATDVEGALERLAVIQHATSTSKEISTAVGARALAQGAELFPGALLGGASRAMPHLGPIGVPAVTGNVCVTNVPGSQAPLYLCGARMESYFGFGPVYDYAGPIHLVVSYLGALFLSVTTCREIVPDTPFYVECLERSLADLVTAAGV
jgi:diacylglycerol O-acyltransferase / wax synthase